MSQNEKQLKLSYQQPLLLTYDSSVSEVTEFRGWYTNEDIQISVNSVNESELYEKPQNRTDYYDPYDIRNLSNRLGKQNFRLVQKAWPRMQILKSAIKNLEEILLAAEAVTEFDPHQKNYFKKIREAIQSPVFAKHEVPRRFMDFYSQNSQPSKGVIRSMDFYADRTGFFQVEGTPENRIAINNQGHIWWNLRKISELPQFDFSQALMILLHEVGHEVSDLTVSEKDMMAAQLQKWVQIRMQSVRLDAYRTLWVLSLRPSLDFDEVNDQNRLSYKPSYDGGQFPHQRHEDRLMEALSRANLCFVETFRSFKESPEIFKQLLKSHDFIRRFENTNAVYGEKVAWPIFLFKKIQLNSVGQLVVNYSIQPKYYSLDQRYWPNSFAKTYPEFKPTAEAFPQQDFKLTSEYGKDSFEIQPSVQSVIPDASFELNQIRKVNNKQYFSLRINSAKINVEQLKKFVLIGRDPNNHSAKALFPLSVRVIDPTTALLHFEAPANGFSVRHLVAPNSTNSIQTYTESVLLPVKEIFLSGAEPAVQQAVTKSEVQIKMSHDQKAFLSVSKNGPGLIKSVMVEIENVVTPLASSYSRHVLGREQTVGFYRIPDFEYESLPEINLIKRFWYSAKKSNQFNVALPQENLTKVVQDKNNPVRVQSMTTFLKKMIEVYPQKMTISDTGYRHIKNIFIYYEDGSIQKIQPESMNYSTERAIKASEKQREKYKKYLESLQISENNEEASVKQLRCEVLFN